MAQHPNRNRTMAHQPIIDRTTMPPKGNALFKAKALQFPLSSGHEIWQMAREMTHNEFVKYYNSLLSNFIQT